ncbi:MAG: iron permease [Rhodobacteraceae bacterium]|nr:iron permease [Paracoccaceae bacterium]MAY45863.1 iron permease [Paracoccaceae bacterium]
MLATLVIALREGLEATLIVGIIAAFLRRNGQGLGPMWLGVALALVLSAAVGLGLAALEQALPQARQEALETVIGAVAIVFVTGMILWMDRHARDMKHGIEAEAAEALNRHSVLALAVMAFLAVLKEGFETAVFLLATFSAAQSAIWATVGAVVGLVLAALIGWAIYAGGVRLNLSRFFRVTGAFLILVAAGLCVTALRTAHEAGWINAGQQLVLQLDWLVQPGTIRAALITGVLGIPSDPRLIEVLGWLAYLVPVALVIYWPRRLRPSARGAALVQLSIGALLAGLSLGLVMMPHPRVPAHGPAPVSAQRGAGHGTARLRGGTLVLDWGAGAVALPESAGQTVLHNGIETRSASAEDVGPVAGPVTGTATLAFDDLVALNGGRRPIGLSPARFPGPYDAEWTATRRADLWSVDGDVLDATGSTAVTVTLSGGGLDTPRTLRVRDLPDALIATVGPAHWQVDPDHVTRVTTDLRQHATAVQEWRFWARHLPLALLAAALILALRGGLRLRSLRVMAPERFSQTQGARAEPAPKGPIQ